MLHAIMDAAQASTSILGSIETDDGIEEFESCNTTPESPDLWRHLSNTVLRAAPIWSWRFPVRRSNTTACWGSP